MVSKNTKKRTANGLSGKTVTVVPPTYARANGCKPIKLPIEVLPAVEVFKYNYAGLNHNTAFAAQMLLGYLWHGFHDAGYFDSHDDKCSCACEKKGKK